MKKCEDCMNGSNNYDRRLFKQAYKDIYNSNTFTFTNK